MIGSRNSLEMKNLNLGDEIEKCKNRIFNFSDETNS